MEKRNCVIFDLDGTICNVSHRQQYVASKPRNWNAWNKGLVNDVPHQPVKIVFDSIQKAAPDIDILLVSGRSDDYYNETVEWLNRYNYSYNKLYMRKQGDYRDDSIVKTEIADEIEKTYNILFVFDDRKRVVDMWVNRGIWVFDCGQGKGDF